MLTTNTSFTIAVAVLALPLAAILTLIYIVRDYRKWVTFGTGNPRGYVIFALQNTYLKISGQPGPLEVAHLRTGDNSTTFLKLKHQRLGPRPAMAPWPVPQRQAPLQGLAGDWLARVQRIIPDLVDEINVQSASKPQLVELARSRLEGNGHAIVIHDSVRQICPDSDMFLREVAHIHGQCHSFHVLLAPADAARVVEHGWGERFGHAGQKAWTGRHKGRRLPSGFVLLYTPRDESEAQVIGDIIKAAVGYALASY